MCVPIVDDRGGFREQIDSGRDGYLCKSADDFSKAVDELLQSAEKLRDVRIAAQQDGILRGSLGAWRDRFVDELSVRLASAAACPHIP
jgi:glycosyltransferase involved in cell wall biosynthesis